RQGGRLWRTEPERLGPPRAPAADRLSAEAGAGTVLGLEPGGGKAPGGGGLPGGGPRAAPVPVGDGIVVATTADTLYLLERASGQVRTRLHTPGTMIAAPALDGARLYAATTAGRLLAIDFPALTVAWDLPA